MPLSNPIKNRLQLLKKEYDHLRKGKESLLVLIAEAEISENVYNSNAIENSTLTLKETERILLEMEVSRDVSLREVFEAKNLARVIEYLRDKSKTTDINKELILFLHQILLNGISDDFAGRFRKKGEYVRVGSYVAPAPEKVEKMIENIIETYNDDATTYFLEKIANFHLDFENIHPFNDGNGRIGRVIINYQLKRLNFPLIIIRNKEKKDYYQAFVDYREKKGSRNMENILALSLMESLHKRIAYLKGEKIIKLSEYIKKHGKSAPAMLNAARRQTIPAFREKGVWKIGAGYKEK